jgi:H+/Cl- antiporter ClcA
LGFTAKNKIQKFQSVLISRITNRATRIISEDVRPFLSGSTLVVDHGGVLHTSHGALHIAIHNTNQPDRRITIGQINGTLTVLLVALFCGLCGALLGRLLFLGLQWRLKMNFKQSFILVVGLSLIFATMVYLIGPQAAGSGKNLIAGILFKDGQSSALVSLARFFGSILSSLSGAAGGIFAPALASGAALGEWIASNLNPNMQNLGPICGMVAFLTGVTRTPVTAFVLILEMTDRHSAIFPMMLAALIADIFARAVDRRSFYENMAESIVQHESTRMAAPRQ